MNTGGRRRKITDGRKWNGAGGGGKKSTGMKRKKRYRTKAEEGVLKG